MKRYSVVIPVFNAEKTLEPLCNQLIEVLGSAGPFEIILVNDNSRDNSDSVCRNLVNQFPSIVTYAQLSRNFGEHNAVMAGLHIARGDYVVIMDDDFQNPPDEVPKLFAEIEKGYDVVYCHYPERKHNIFRRLGSYLNGSMARIVIHKPVDLYLSSFKALNRFMVENVIMYEGPYPYIDAIVLRTTTNIGIIEVKQDMRKEGESGYTLAKLLALWGNMMVGYSLVPIRIMGGIGLVLTIIGICALIVDLARELIPYMKDPTDIETLTAVTMFFRGFQLLAFSIVGEYVGRIYLSLNKEPQYIIREVVRAVPGDASEQSSKICS